jgi:hypothetical protein
MKSTIAIATAGVLAVGAGAIIGANLGAKDAQAAPVEVTAEQLLINQRISQAAVRRSNTGLNYLRSVRTPALDTSNNTGVQPPIGTGWTSAALAANSVGTSEIQNASVTAAKLAPGAAQPRLAVRTATSALIAPGNSTGAVTSNCNPGEVAVGGGFSAATPGGGGNPVVVDRPNPATPGGVPNGWTVNVFNNSGVANTYTVYAVCSS